MSRIKVLNVDVSTAGNGPRKYEVAEVLYEQNGEKKDKKVVSFSNPAVFKTIKEAKNGDVFDLTVAKDDKGYWQWTSITPAGSESSSGTPSSTPAAKTAGGNWETKEEREARQRYIIRQSSLSNAVTALSAGAKTPPKFDEIKALADQFVSYVYDLPDIFSADFPNDIPE